MKAKRAKPPHESRGDADALPALRDFARAYLHEDVLAEHGGAIGAAAGFSGDASPDEIRALANDLTLLLSKAKAWPIDVLERYFSQTLKSGWRPRSLADLRALEAEVRRFRP